MIRLNLLAFAVAFALTAQSPQPAQTDQATQAAPIKVTVTEVIVPVTVTDKKGRFVSDLDVTDFKIFDEGKEQKITHFNRERNQPVVVGFLLDLSSYSNRHWKVFQEAALDLVNTILPGDPKYSGYLITYSNDAELAVNTSSDPEKMMDRIRKAKPGGGAALYDAIYMACTSRDLVKGEPIEPRRIIVIIGDGHDNASKKSLREVLELAHRNLVTIYAVSTQAFGFHSEGDATLRQIADETGGRVEYPLNSLYKNVSGYLSTPSDEGNYAYKVGTGGYASEVSKGVFNAIAAITGEITTQYILRYVPSDSDSAAVFRKITVQVNLLDVEVRAKQGYYPFNP